MDARRSTTGDSVAGLRRSRLLHDLQLQIQADGNNKAIPPWMPISSARSSMTRSPGLDARGRDTNSP
jgi:hypothetical protein